MAAVAMVTKMQKMLNSLQTVDPFETWPKNRSSPFPWQRQPFWKNQPLKAQIHMAYDITTRFHKVWSRHLRETCRTKKRGVLNKFWIPIIKLHETL
jgi:hypothetical protein